MGDYADLDVRIACLDSGAFRPSGRKAPLDDVQHVISVIQQIVPSADEGRRQIAMHADTADTIQRRCRLLDRLGDMVPSVVNGPCDLSAQYWIATGRHGQDSQAGGRVLREEKFDAINAGALRVPSVKPFGLGLFTSTGMFDTPGMWRSYLRGYEESSLYPRPWITWHTLPRRDVAVYEISSAERWVELLDTYPRVHDGLVYPDWALVADAYDAVHVALRAVVATQGISFAGRHGRSAKPFWDVETTWWLRWCFSSIEAVESGCARQTRSLMLPGETVPFRADRPDARSRNRPSSSGNRSS